MRRCGQGKLLAQGHTSLKLQSWDLIPKPIPRPLCYTVSQAMWSYQLYHGGILGPLKQYSDDAI